MAFLNLNYQVLIYEDKDSRNPLVRMPDLTKSVNGVVVSNDKSDRITVYPNEIKDIVVTARTLSQDATTNYEFTRYIASGDNVRLMWTGTGTAPAFRSKRAIVGGADTEVTISRVNAYVARVANTGGTAWSLATVQIGDILKFEKNTDDFTSPFSVTNQGQTYIVQNKGVDFVDIIDNGVISLDANIVLGADFDFALRIMSTGPVKIGDIVEISGPDINPSNKGRFQIIDVSPEYLEFTSPYGVNQTFDYGTNTIVTYDYLIGFINLRSTDQVKIRFGGQTEWATIQKLCDQAIFMGSVSTYKIEAYNDGAYPLEISVQHAMINS